MNGEQALAGMVVDALKEQGINAVILAGDSIDPRNMPCVTVKAVKGQSDPHHTSNFVWELTITARARTPETLGEVSDVVESISTEEIYDAVTRHGEFRVFCITNDGGAANDTDHTRSYTVRFSLWASDLRHSSAA